MAPDSSPACWRAVEGVDEQLLAGALAGGGAVAVDVADGVAQQRFLVGVQGAGQPGGVVRLADQQRVQREQKLGLLIGDMRRGRGRPRGR